MCAQSISDRFWAKVEKSEECWLWRGAINRQGYGVIHNLGGPRLAHRLGWELAFGPIPAGLEACHHCDNPLCVKHEHLFLGTHADNMRDMAIKGRSNRVGALRQPTVEERARGERVGGAVLTAEQVVAMRREWEFRKVTKRMLAERYGVSYSTVKDIIRRATWRHV